MTGAAACRACPGVKKVDDRTIRISLTRCDDTILKTLTGICIAPLHVYGDVSLFDPDNDSFGFTKGNLSSVRAKQRQGGRRGRIRLP